MTDTNGNYVPKNIEFIPTVDDWRNFLERWSEAILNNIDEEDMEHYELYFSDVLEKQSCLQKSATEAAIAELEERLGEKLPTSYRNFLLASNGFMIVNEDCELYGTEQIKWLIEDNSDWIEDWDDGYEIEDEKYFQYGEHQNSCWIRGQYLKTALLISSDEDGYFYLLNPQIVDSRKEWEAWDFGCKYPGAYRYRSFWEMMQKVSQRSFDA